ncbi:hypothetical protein PGTUg99_027301 [Puccinia graminis f. sp. tritici]|uniref:Uncharacterized protein n=1 Tax=Puccinia graminis f. sp. tritici TaxID=56615 RepID=A0A5B0PJK7_PUCGR|nr:hypothetical protein PGTUg99_027301 [Puccinia graminis f. sp. tritici]
MTAPPVHLQGFLMDFSNFRKSCRSRLGQCFKPFNFGTKKQGNSPPAIELRVVHDHPQSSNQVANVDKVCSIGQDSTFTPTIENQNVGANFSKEQDVLFL